MMINVALYAFNSKFTFLSVPLTNASPPELKYSSQSKSLMSRSQWCSYSRY